MSGRCSEGMPGPLSRTVRTISAPCLSAVNRICPASGVCLIAFAARFCSACSSRSASATTDCAAASTRVVSVIRRSARSRSCLSATRLNSCWTSARSCCSVMPPPSSLARSSRSPMICSSRCVSSVTMLM